jgi:hypothetical protein
MNSVYQQLMILWITPVAGYIRDSGVVLDTDMLWKAWCRAKSDLALHIDWSDFVLEFLDHAGASGSDYRKLLWAIGKHETSLFT